MQQEQDAARDKVERKIINISEKRQITIPKKYFNALAFGSEAECILQEDGLLIRPMRSQANSELAAQILSDLIAQGYDGQVLLEKFKERSGTAVPQ